MFYCTREPETGLASEQVSGQNVKMLYSSDPEGNQTRKGLLDLLQNANSTPVLVKQYFLEFIFSLHFHFLFFVCKSNIKLISITPLALL